MEKSLVIVESPAKAKTIGKYLGKQFVVKASLGHVKDLPKKNLSVDVDNDFKPVYEVIEGKKKLMGELKTAAKGVDNVYLAADPDREGEAICFHLQEELQKKDGPKFFRVMFNEITKNAIQKAFEKPLAVNLHLVDAQQARRILDRLVGYKISPLLWDKVRRGLSDGRLAADCGSRARDSRVSEEGILDHRRQPDGEEASAAFGSFGEAGWGKRRDRG
jgi:DNA topoisomerase-1